jgi:hypothetical protein
MTANVEWSIGEKRQTGTAESIESSDEVSEIARQHRPDELGKAP